jgi:hypothetical protein
MQNFNSQEDEEVNQRATYVKVGSSPGPGDITHSSMDDSFSKGE